MVLPDQFPEIHLAEGMDFADLDEQHVEFEFVLFGGNLWRMLTLVQVFAGFLEKVGASGVEEGMSGHG